MKLNIKRAVQIHVAVAALLTVTLIVIHHNLEGAGIRWPQPVTQPSSFFKSFSSYEELKGFLARTWYTHRRDRGLWRDAWFLFVPFPFLQRIFIRDAIPVQFAREFRSMGSPEFSQPQGYCVSDPAYSTTNVQVAGVDEADVMKTDGKYMYAVSGEYVLILRAYPPEEAKLLSRISLGRAGLREVFVSGDKLVVLSCALDNSSIHAYDYTPFGKWFPLSQITKLTSIMVYDISDRANPILRRELSVDGSYFNSRMIGDYAYVVISKPAYVINDTVAMPTFYVGGRAKHVRATEVYYVDTDCASYSFTTVIAINVQDDREEPKYLTILMGSASCMYVSLNNIYVTFPKRTKSGELTAIYRIRVKDGDMVAEANGTVPGSVLNQFSMDEYGDHFRVATTKGLGWRSTNNIYVLDMNMNIVGKLEGLAQGERIYSARFMGKRCYLVTFREIDPFFVIDVGDPTKPKVLGELKIPGFSSYLHPYDENYVIGVGMENWSVKISLFDVTDASSPAEVSKYIIRDRSSTLVLNNHKAFLFDKSRDILVIPVTVRGWNGSAWQGAYVFNVSPHKGITFRGGITHQRKTNNVLNNELLIKRAFYIDHILYTVSDKKVKMNDVESLETVNEVELP